VRYKRLSKWAKSEKKLPQTTIVKTLNIQNKGRILKVQRQKQQVTYKDKPIRITDFLIETLNARRAWNELYQALKENNC
jgi:hypothetical protein